MTLHTVKPLWFYHL